MGKYRATVPPRAKQFTYDGVTYGPGSTFPNDDACAIKGFAAAFKAANTDAGVKEENKGVIQSLDTECPSGTAPSPAAAPPSAPIEEQSAKGEPDSATRHGAPEPPLTATIGQDPQAEPNPAQGDEPIRPETGQPHDTHGGETPQLTVKAGDPVDIFNGALYLEETDLEIPNSIPPLAFIRTYRSGAAAYGPFGWNWDHNYNLFIRELSTGNVALWRNLHEDIFRFDGAAFQPPRGVFELLERVPGLSQTYELTGAGGTVMRFERPATWIDGERIPIREIRDRHGNTQRFTYGTADELEEVRDDDDRFLHFRYDACGLLTLLSDSGGRQFHYEHDEQTMQLVGATGPPTADQLGGSTRRYHYEQPFAPPQLRHNILRVEDADGRVFIENAYEQDPASWSYARVTTQLWGGYLYQFRYTSLQWVPDNELFINIAAVRVEVMNPDFTLETYTFNYRGDLLDRRCRLTSDGSFRVVVHQYLFDEQGNLAAVTHPDGSQDLKTYDALSTDPRRRGLLLKREITAAAGFPSPSRIVWQGKYDAVYQLLTEETDERATVTRYKYDFDTSPGALTKSGTLSEVIAPDATLPDGVVQKSRTVFEVNTRGQILAVVLADGVRHEMEYGVAGPGRGRLVRQTFDKANVAVVNQITYDGHGFETAFVDGNGHTHGQVRNALGLVESITLPVVGGAAAEHILHYDSDRQIVGYERPKGTFTGLSIADTHLLDAVERDVLGRPEAYRLSQNTSEARTHYVSCDFRGHAVDMRNPDGSRARSVYDERGLLLKEDTTGSDGTRRSVSRAYDRAGKVLASTDAAGLTTRFRYDGFSRLSNVTRPNGSVVHYTWLPGDLVASEEITGDDGTGVIRQLAARSFTYDERRRKTSETVQSFLYTGGSSVAVTRRHFHDRCDRLESVIDNRGGVTRYKRDGLGRVTATIDPLGNEDRLSYDANGNVTGAESHHVEPDGSVTVRAKQHAYDARNRRIRTIEPDGSATEVVYDDRDLPVRETDRLGARTDGEYDSFANRTREIEDVGGVNAEHAWTFDNMSRLASYTDPVAQISRYRRDGIGRLTRTEYPSGATDTRTYAPNGLIEREQLTSGVVFEFDHDAANRLIRVRNTAAPAIIARLALHEFAYDGMDRCVSAKVGTHAVGRQFDSLGRLVAELTNGAGITCSYDDPSGTVMKRWPDGRTERLRHDLNGTITECEEIAHSAMGAGFSPIAQLTPSGRGWIGAAKLQQVAIVNKFDDRKRLVETAMTSPAGLDENLQYRYDRADRMRVEALSGSHSAINLFTYDTLNRLVDAQDGFTGAIPDATTQPQHDTAIGAAALAAAGATHRESFQHNPAGPRIKATETGAVPRTYTYLPGHRLQSDGIAAYSHHSDGTLESDGAFTYHVDALGRVLSIDKSGVVVCRFEYDAFWRPALVEESGGPARTYTYLGSFVEQESVSGGVSRHITVHPLTGVPLAYHDAGDTSYPLFDLRYNLIALADPLGNLRETYGYKAFGAPVILDAAGNAVPVSAFNVAPIFGGQRYLRSVGLYLSTRRLLSPETGQFLSTDLRAYTDSSSLYVYARQDPVNHLDPEGDVVPLILAVAAIGGALIGAGYSIYDATQNPDKYAGWGALRPLLYVFGAAGIGVASVAAGEGVLAAGGLGTFASGSGVAALGTTEAYLLYGASSAVSGGVGRAGIHGLFPDYVDPVTTRSMSVDFVSGGAIGGTFRVIANYAAARGFATFPTAPVKGAAADWLRFGEDLGGSAPTTGGLGPYPGRIGAVLDRVGIRQGLGSNVVNNDVGRNWFAAVDTAFHEGFHVFIARYLPTFRQLSLVSRGSAIARYPEEVVAYAFGHAAAGRIHGVPFAPFEAFNSLGGYGPTAVNASKAFWGRVGGTAAVAATEREWGSDEGPGRERKGSTK